MKLEGLKINFLGDSITEGVGVSTPENIYWNRLSRDCNLAEARGYGIGGTRFAKQVNLAPLSTYVHIIHEVTEYYSLPVLDLWSVSGIQPRGEIIKQKYCPDGLHPNDAGHALIAARLKGFLEAL